MVKVLPVLRTLFLVFAVIYLLRALPLAVLLLSDTKQGSFTVNLDVLKDVAGAAWVAIAWIALETAIGWVGVWMRSRKARAAAAAPAPAKVP